MRGSASLVCAIFVSFTYVAGQMRGVGAGDRVRHAADARSGDAIWSRGACATIE